MSTPAIRITRLPTDGHGHFGHTRELRESGCGVVSPVTVAELQAGVLAATDLETRARRLATLETIADIEVLSIFTSDDGFSPLDWVGGLNVIRV